ncbi:MAG: acyl-CoA dehydrogenase [Acidobacteria bacterium]|nr:acyl-CoA dehydrogenase [Acidobacteriota bacterium]
MTTTKNPLSGGQFLFTDSQAADIFTREDISEEQRMFARVAEEFMRKEVLPREEQIYSKDWSVTRELLLKAGELDLLRVDIPEEYGGLSLDKISSALIGEAIALMPSFGASLGAHTTIGTLPIVFFGTPAQRAKYLPKLASGELIAAYCLTEPGSGSDAMAAKTKAILSADGKHYVLNGQKMWITNGGFADVFIIFAKVDGDKFTAFIVERDHGVVSGHEEKKLGLDGSSTTALMLEDCRVPVENVLGEIGKGHVVAFNVLNLGRLKLGTRNLGSAKLALNNAISYSKERHQFGKAIGEFGLIKRKLAEMAIRCFVGDAMVWRTLGMIDGALEQVDQSQPMQVLKAIEQYAVECSIIKVWTSEALGYVVDETVQVYGGYGYSKDYPAERAYRDARITRLYEGTNEINRTIIATRLLKAAASGGLPLRARVEYLKEWPYYYDRRETEYSQKACNLVRGMAVLSLDAIQQAYGDQTSPEQEVLALAAEMVMEAYAIESVLLRMQKISPANRVIEAMARTYACAAAHRTELNSQYLVEVLKTVMDTKDLEDHFSEYIVYDFINPVLEHRTIADALRESGRYLW